MTDRRPYDVDDDLDDPYDDAPRRRATTTDDDPGRRDRPRRRRYAAPTPRRRRRRAAGASSSLGVAVARAARCSAPCGVWVQRQIDPPGSPGEVRSHHRPGGRHARRPSASCWPTRAIITSAFVWDWYLRINGGGPFQAGDYELAEDSAMGDVVDILDAGPRRPRSARFTVPEGFTVDGDRWPASPIPRRASASTLATLQQLLDSGQVRSAYQPADQPSNEGILFPETYRVDAGGRRRWQVLQQMVGQLDATMAELDVESAQERFNLTPYEILIVASLIEEETKVARGAAEGRPGDLQPAAPGHPPRHRRHLALRGGAEPAATASDIDFTSDSPYNTRKVQGPAAHADRVARAGPASRRPCTPPTGRGSTTCSRTRRAPLLHRQRQRVPRRQAALPRRRARLRVMTGTRAGVIGSPIGTRCRPAIFNAAFAAAGLDWAYLAFEVPEGDGRAFARRGAQRSARGLSVTMPHKAAVIPALDELDPDRPRPRRGELHRARRRRPASATTPTAPGFVDALAVDEAASSVGGLPLRGARRRGRGPGGGPGARPRPARRRSSW